MADVSQAGGPLGKIRALRLRVYRFVKRKAQSFFGLTTRGADTEFSNLDLDAEVIVYFPDDTARLYQMEQWLPVFDELNRHHKVMIIARNINSFRALRNLTQLSTIFLRRLRDLNEVLEHNNFKVALYVNNSSLNFHCLMFSTLLHMHLNHGESDKVSMASNQAKAYDRVLVAGQAAIDRYVNNLIELDTRKLVTVGRPQLDVKHPRVLRKSSRPTVLYAPTWEGEREAMNYTSIDVFGASIVEQLLASGEFRLVYKPHPRVTDVNATTGAGHTAILAAIEAAQQREPEIGHLVEMKANIQALFDDCAAMISDVSSVGLDFLYQATGKPLFLTDRRNDMERLLEAAPVAAGSYIVNASTADDIVSNLRAALAADEKRDDRERMRRYYFGDIARGDSTKRFLESVDEAIAVRDAAMDQRRRHAPATAHHEAAVHNVPDVPDDPPPAVSDADPSTAATA